MDVSKYMKQKNVWIFDETFKDGEENIGMFVKSKEYLTNGGKKEDVFVLAVGGVDYMIMPFKLDYVDFVEKYGPETDNWNGKHFVLSKNAKGKYTIRTIEETI